MTQQQQGLQKAQQPQTGLVGIDGSGKNSLAKLNMRDLKELAEVFVASGAFGDVKQTAQAIVKIIAGQELGFSPIVSMTGVHFFNGKVTIGSNLIASLIKESPKYEYKILQHTETICEIAFFQYIGGELKSLGGSVYYTWEDAQKAGLVGKDNWKKYPKDMLFAACIRQGARRFCADIFRGIAPDTDTVVDENSEPATDTSDMDDAAAQNVTIDAEPIEEENGAAEAVDMTTGEVIETEAVSGDEEQTLFSGPPPDEEESVKADLIAGISELLVEKVGKSAGEQKTFLKGKILGNESRESLQDIFDTLQSM